MLRLNVWHNKSMHILSQSQQKEIFIQDDPWWTCAGPRLRCNRLLDCDVLLARVSLTRFNLEFDSNEIDESDLHDEQRISTLGGITIDWRGLLEKQFWLGILPRKTPLHEPFDSSMEHSRKNSEIPGNTGDRSVEDLLCRSLCASAYLNSFSGSQWHIGWSKSNEPPGYLTTCINPRCITHIIW
jgi:hypothetical protein